MMLLLAGCRWIGLDPPTGDEDRWAIVGSIVDRDVRIPLGDPPSIHVKEDPDDECGIIFLIRSSTEIRRRSPDGALLPASYDDLTVGENVKVRAPVILESCPAQAQAEVVEIVP